MTDQQHINQLYAAIYRDHSAGGPLHLVLDDGNVEDRHLDYATLALADEDDHWWDDWPDLAASADALLGILRPLTPTQRTAAITAAQDHWHNRWTPPDARR